MSASVAGAAGARDCLEGDILGDRSHDFAFLAPDLCDDTHDCAVRNGDRFLARVVPALLSALGPHGFLVVTYDEGLRAQVRRRLARWPHRDGARGARRPKRR